MALSEEEQRLLDQMEAALAAEDPKLVNAMRGTGMRRLHRRRAAIAGDIATAVAINNKVFPLHQKLFIEPNPVPVKWALAEMGKMPAGIRLPLVPLAADCHAAVRAALQEAGVL